MTNQETGWRGAGRVRNPLAVDQSHVRSDLHDGCDTIACKPFLAAATSLIHPLLFFDPLTISSGLDHRLVNWTQVVGGNIAGAHSQGRLVCL